MIPYAISALVLMAFLLVGCSSYGHKHFEAPLNSTAPYRMHFVQVDDYGIFWDATEAQYALDEVSKVSQDSNVIVLLFVHGWHHNAHGSDDNLENFKKTLCDLTEQLDLPMYVESRKLLTGTPNVKVIGIYVGWRGRSMPGNLDYLTSWGRKSAAERVGAGDFKEFLVRLQGIYEERNVSSPSSCKPFMGLALTGHSFGAQVLLKAASDTIEQNLVKATDGLSGVTKAQTQAPQSPVEGIGDIVVLLNPALEAYQFERISQLSKRLECSYNQTPVLLVVSGEGDKARQFAFPVARWLTRPFRPGFRQGQKPLWHEALGEYRPQRTHELKLAEPGTSNTLSEASYLDPETVIQTDFSAPITLGGASLTRIPEQSFNANNPVVVAYTSSKLIEGHNGIFTGDFSNFLTDYVAFVEGKKMLLRRMPTACEPNDADSTKDTSPTVSSESGRGDIR